MKVALLLADGKYSVVSEVVQIISTVLKELDIQIDSIDVTQLPYFSNCETNEMKTIIKKLDESKGVIAVSSVPLIGIHGAMQSFFDHMSLGEEVVIGKPLLAITYSECIGEMDAANMIIRAWSLLGGYSAGTISLNNSINLEKLAKPLEKNIESFYRFIKQDQLPVVFSERQYYIQTKQKTKKSIGQAELNEEKIFSRILSQATQSTEMVESSHSSESEEKMSYLLKRHLEITDEKQLESMQIGTYKKPSRRVEKSNSFKQLQGLPHYFIAQHEKELELTVQYLLIDTQEKAYITIKNGNCEYHEGLIDKPILEISLTEDTLRQVIKRIITYQKAFMIGKLKVRGNFALVSKLDQIFKPL